jgi:hypothetical protein
MASSPNPDLIAKAIRHLPRTFLNCHAIAQALIDTNQPFVKDACRRIFSGMTEFEKARRITSIDIRSIIERLQQVHEEELRPDIIRAIAHLEQVAQRCRQCPEINLRNLADGKPFACIASDSSRLPADAKFRFKLGAGGQIIESI